MKNTTHKTKFRGLLTQLLCEAFYLESSEKENIIEDLLPFEKEEQADQNDFIRNFLKPYQTSIS